MWRSTGSGYPTAPADGPACGEAHQAQREALALPVELRAGAGAGAAGLPGTDWTGWFVSAVGRQVAG